MTLEPEVENRIMYIPVADATQGWTPKLSNRGLKMAPPPSPKAPDMNPPRNANVTNLKRTDAFSRKSLGAMPAPTFLFNAYSFITALAASPESKRQYTMKANKMSQSS